MSKLDDILIKARDYVMALLDGKDPEVGESTKQQIKDLFLELIDSVEEDEYAPDYERELVKKVKQL